MTLPQSECAKCEIRAGRKIEWARGSWWARNLAERAEDERKSVARRLVLLLPSDPLTLRAAATSQISPAGSESSPLGPIASHRDYGLTLFRATFTRQPN